MIENPMWELIQTLPTEESMWNGKPEVVGMGIEIDRVSHQLVFGPSRPSRKWVCSKYSWAIAEPGAIEFIAKHTRNTGLVEMGAGTGYWANMLSQAGVDVIAYDRDPPTTRYNHWHVDRDGDSWMFDYGADKEKRGIEYFRVRRGYPGRVRKHPTRTLFLCWPPYSDPMAYRTLQAYTGNQLIYIGEQDGGCTADPDFFKEIEKGWTQIAGWNLVQWQGIHDDLSVYRRNA